MNINELRDYPIVSFLWIDAFCEARFSFFSFPVLTNDLPNKFSDALLAELYE